MLLPVVCSMMFLVLLVFVCCGLFVACRSLCGVACCLVFVDRCVCLLLNVCPSLLFVVVCCVTVVR